MELPSASPSACPCCACACCPSVTGGGGAWAPGPVTVARRSLSRTMTQGCIIGKIAFCNRQFCQTVTPIRNSGVKAHINHFNALQSSQSLLLSPRFRFPLRIAPRRTLKLFLFILPLSSHRLFSRLIDLVVQYQPVKANQTARTQSPFIPQAVLSRLPHLIETSRHVCVLVV